MGSSNIRTKTAADGGGIEALTAVEFFAGIGLVRLALERQGWEVLWANDIDPKKAKMYQANFGRSDFVLGDIHKIPADAVPDCRLYTASFPCNDLSIAGAMEGLHGKESGAFWGLIRILKEKGHERPQLVLLENVVGFLMCKQGRDFEAALAALCELGYSVDAFIVNASAFVPQSRPRLFVIARHCGGEGIVKVAAQSDVRPAPLAQFINLTPHLLWDIQPLPPLPHRKLTLMEIVEDLPDSDLHWWSQGRTDYFMGQLSPKHKIAADNMIEGKSVSYATAFRRVRKGRSMAELRTDGLAGCLRTPRGGSGRQILFKAGKGRHQVRLLTARECARLQGVPDDFNISVPLNQALFGFGDAVCVPVIDWIVKYYLNRIAQVTTSKIAKGVAA